MTSLLRRITEASTVVRRVSPRSGRAEPGRDEPPAEVPGGVVDTRTEVVGRFATRLDEHPAAGFAQMLLQRLPEGRMRLTAGGPPGLPRLTHEFDAPVLGLGLLTSKIGKSPSAVYLKMVEWSRVYSDLRFWLDDVRAAVGDSDLRLVIWDDTGYEVPWELFYLYGDEATGLRGGWLGELVAVTRKVTVAREGRDRRTDQVYADQVAEGEVVSCIADDMLADSATIERFRHQPVAERDLLSSLQAAGPDVALLYVACHGTFAPDLTMMTLGQIALPQLTGIRMPGLESTQGLVFLNACHSGRMGADSNVKGALFGFGEAFLRRGASVVIGAAGAVETHVACEVASLILEQLAAHPELPVSAALRDARARIAAGVSRENPTEEQIKALVYGFMFVGYGNPFARVRLPAAGEH